VIQGEFRPSDKPCGDALGTGGAGESSRGSCLEVWVKDAPQVPQKLFPTGLLCPSGHIATNDSSLIPYSGKLGEVCGGCDRPHYKGELLPGPLRAEATWPTA
jgi:hypothetical protein